MFNSDNLMECCRSLKPSAHLHRISPAKIGCAVSMAHRLKSEQKHDIYPCKVAYVITIYIAKLLFNKLSSYALLDSSIKSCAI